MKLLILTFATLISFSAMAQSVSCRQAVVLGHLALGENIDENSFSVNSPEDFNMSSVDFNTLSSEAQEQIFLSYTPLETMVKNTTGTLEANISYIKRDPFLAYYYKDQLKVLEDSLEVITSCQYL